MNTPSTRLWAARSTGRSVLLFVLLALWPGISQAFVHPGGLHTQADLDRMKAKVAAGEQPWLDSWNALLQNSKAQSTYNPAPNPNMGASRQRASADAVAAYFNALRGYIADSPAHTDNAIRICNLWSAAVNQIPSGTDQPGLSGIYAYQFAIVGELLRIHVGTRWAPEDFARFQNMVRNYLYPVVHDFLVHHNNACITHYWANWDAANIAALAAIGVFLDDQAIFDEGLEYYTNGAGNGNIHHAVFTVHPGGPGQPYGLGQWQETGRDQEHNILGVGLLATFCQIAWNQGVDMFGYDNNRLLAGAEYVAQYAIGQSVPYAFFDNCDDVNQYWPAAHDRGRLQRPIWELLYNHYVVRQGLSAPSLSAISALNRPEGFSHDDHFGYGTLAFTLNASVSGYPASAPATPQGLTSEAGVGSVSLQWNHAPTANGYVVQRATTSGGPFTTLATYRGTMPTYYDASVTNGTTYYYRVAASNQAGTSGESTETSATPLAESADLPDGWMRRDVGTVAAAGSATYGTPAGGTFSVSGSGTGIGGSADGLGYAFATVDGDATITARRIGASLGGVGGNGRIGIMFRESLAPDAKTQTLVVGDLGFREARFGTRATTGGAMTFITGNGYSAGAWFRLVRSGDTFTALQSGDGVTWYVVGSTVAAMPETVHVGIAVAANSASVITGVFDHVTLDGTILPGSPGALTAINGHGQVSLSWSASPGAESYDLKRASVSGGPYTVIASGLTSTSYVDTGLTDGTSYYYVVASRQGNYGSVNSEEALGIPGDISSVWSTTPPSGNWSNAANWIGGALPESGSSLAFGASSIASLANDLTGFGISRLAFNSGAPAYTIGGNKLALAGNVTNGSSATQTLTLDLALTGTPTIETRSGAIALRGVISDGSGLQGLVKAGPQALFLSGLNTFSGDVQLTAGTLSIAGVGTGSVGAPTAGALGRGTVRLTGGVLTSSAAATIYNHVVVPEGATASIASSTANLTFAGKISGGGTINESGGNTGGTHFNGDNSGFTGTFNSSNAGSHRIRFNTPSAGSAAATWVLNNSQTDGNGFAFAAGTGTIDFGALSGSGVFRNNAIGTATMRIGALNKDTTFSGSIVANGTRFIAVEKIGTGRLTFTGNSTYDGATTVSGGTLLINGSHRSAVTANAGSFGGSGSSAAAVTVNAGASFEPGNLAVGTFTTAGALTLNAGSTYQLQLNSTTGAADKIIAASVKLSGANLAATDLGDTSLAAGTRFTILDNTGSTAVNGTFAGLAEGALFDIGANRFRISYVGGTGNEVVLTAVVPVDIALSNLAQTYNGEPRPIGVTTTPADVAVNITYNGSAAVPTDAGSYAVVVSPADPNYLGSAEGTLVIAKASASVTLGALEQTYDGSPKSVTVTSAPAGLPAMLSYNGSATAPTDAGSYAVTAVVDHPNYLGSAAGTLVVAKAEAEITLTPLSQPYTGTPREVTATTLPAGLTVNLSYDGAENAPVYPGEHTVVATIDDPNYTGTVSDALQITITALVRHGPTFDGMVDGSVQVLAAENVILNGESTLSGDLLAPGTPTLQLNGSPTVGGVKDGPGIAAPTTHTVTINGGAVVRYVVRRVDAIALPSVATPPKPTGTRSITLTSSGQSIGNPVTLKNLTLSGGAGEVAVPPGTYGSFTANGGTGFVLGVAGAVEPAVYNLQSLTLNGSATLRVVGPVTLTLGSGLTFSGTVGTGGKPEWLTLRLATGGVTLNTGATLHGEVLAPAGTVSIGSNAAVHGMIRADRLQVATDGLLDDSGL